MGDVVISIATAGHELSSSRARPAQSVSSLAVRGHGPCALLTDLAPAQSRDPDEVVGKRDDPHRRFVAAVQREPARVACVQAGAKDRFHRIGLLAFSRRETFGVALIACTASNLGAKSHPGEIIPLWARDHVVVGDGIIRLQRDGIIPE